MLKCLDLSPQCVKVVSESKLLRESYSGWLWSPEQVPDFMASATGALSRLTDLWVALLRLLVIPLVASHLFLAFRSVGERPRLGRLGIRAHFL